MNRQSMGGVLVLTLATAWIGAVQANPLAGVAVRSDKGNSVYVAEGVVEAVRQTVVSAQVPGVINKLAVKAGDVVKSGQLLLQIDARAADQMSLASQAKAEEARTALNVANKDYERQKQLYAQEYISPAAMERAEAQYRAAQAQVNAALAQATAARAQTGFYTLNAPYGGLVADVDVTLGDMAMPGRPLLTVYDPSAIRVTAIVPQARAEQIFQNARLRIEIPSLPEGLRWYEANASKLLPKADASTHTMQLRLDLPPGTRLAPGTFARVHLPVAAEGGQRLFAPAKAVFKRAELTAVYVLDDQGKPRLRQVKTGPLVGDEVEILSGLSVGERVAVDPLAASRQP